MLNNYFYGLTLWVLRNDSDKIYFLIQIIKLIKLTSYYPVGTVVNNNDNNNKKKKKKKKITKTCLYNFDPHKPHFYIVKLGFTGVYIIFLISAQKHKLWVLVRTASSRRF